ncbi:MAG: SUF system NifU family Fe-S cluster assembly protein [Candidatus Krumholzibacteria bacterium]|nr:SUF system NifU family Fe-S cluster assembly protein [Candidatus Krumholzibacteria bacterium]MDH4337586.1 SUF system NifU family Fe-S cluster assembly protein [Candidatus Krumholzibacteria bacterium]MDH5270388.1 SUF system NifU family Fe-S cluster assembly protein [Candidatus Krumholzibacteria bacterium]
MSDMRELYQEVILDHHKHPRNFGRLDGANRHAEGFNPLCGDRVTVYVLVENDVVREIAFDGSGCAICVASASVMTDELKGRTLAEIEKLYGTFHDVVMSSTDTAVDMDALGKLAVFAGVREFPVRVKCATLPWHTLRAALKNPDGAPVTTE